jgi:hypothetical protein
VRRVVDAVLEELQPVGAHDERRELGPDLALAGVRDLVVMHFDLDAQAFEREADRRADVLQRIDRGHGKIAALDRGPVPHVAAFELLGRRPRRLAREDLAVAARHVDRPLDRVENEELGLRAEVRDVAQAGRLEIGLGALGERAGVALVTFAVGRLDDIAGEEQRRLLQERIEVRRRGVGHQQHVRHLNALPAGDRGTVERVTVGELFGIEGLGRHGNVLLLAAGVGEAEVDELDLLVLDRLEHVGWACHAGLLGYGGLERGRCTAQTERDQKSENCAMPRSVANLRSGAIFP